MSEAGDEGWARLKEKRDKLRRRIAETAADFADNEEKIARTYEQRAEHRPPADAARLRQEAEKARTTAAKERQQSRVFSNQSDEAPADERELALSVARPAQQPARSQSRTRWRLS